MGRGQLKYRNRGSRGGGSARGRGGGRSHDVSKQSSGTPAPQRRGRAKGARIADLPSNTEKWGSAFDGGGDGRQAIASIETERLLDESGWVTGPQFGALEDDAQLLSVERSPEIDGVEALPAGSGSLLSLDLGMLSTSLMAIVPSRRLGLPPAYCAGVEWVDPAIDSSLDPALEPISGLDDDLGKAIQGVATSTTTAQRDAMPLPSPLGDDEEQGVETEVEADEGGNNDLAEDAAGLASLGSTTEDCGRDASGGGPTVGSGHGEGRRRSDEESAPGLESPSRAQVHEDGVLDALLDLSLGVSASKEGSSRVAGLVAGSGLLARERTPRTSPAPAPSNSPSQNPPREVILGSTSSPSVGLSSGGNARGSGDGADELEDWLDGVLEDD